MRKINRFFITVLVISITLIGCTKIDPINPGDINKNRDIVENEELSEEQKTMNTFLDMIKPESSAADLGIYIRENIGKVTQDDAEKMIQWLTVYQTEITEGFREKIYTLPYMEALNVSMEGTLNKDKIGNISNEDVRKDYQNLIDGFMTIIRYEETPVVEIDWKALNELSPFVSEDFKITLELYQKIKNYEYNREYLDVKGIAEDIIKVESILANHKSDFIYSKVNEIYNIQIYSLLIGPEGNYLGFFIDKDSKEYKDILELKEEYPNSFLGQMIVDLEKTDYKNPMEVYDVIHEKLQFGIELNKHLKTKIFEVEDIKYYTFEFKIPEDQEKQNRINSIIKLDLDQYAEKLIDKAELALSAYSIYQDKQYFSYNIFIDYKDIEGNPESLIFYRTFDYINEKHISLEEYLNCDFNELKDYVKSIKGVEIFPNQGFQISDNGIDLFIENLKGMGGYIQLNKKDLIPFLSLERLVIKY